MLLDKKSSRKTEEFLLGISKRLSSREDCKDIEYKVIIHHNVPRMENIIYVYPDSKHRKQANRTDVVEHILKAKDIHVIDLIDGTYVYHKIGKSKKRTWERID